MHKNLKNLRRQRRHWHGRKRAIGTPEKPRLCLFRSSKHLYCQLIDDTFVDKKGDRSGRTLAACSTLTATVVKQISSGGNSKAAVVVGTEIAKLAKEKGITKITFDRGGYKYHGRIKALADAARKGGLKF